MITYLLYKYNEHVDYLTLLINFFHVLSPYLQQNLNFILYSIKIVWNWQLKIRTYLGNCLLFLIIVYKKICWVTNDNNKCQLCTELTLGFEASLGKSAWVKHLCNYLKWFFTTSIITFSIVTGISGNWEATEFKVKNKWACSETMFLKSDFML